MLFADLLSLHLVTFLMFFILVSIYCVSTLSLHIESTDSMISVQSLASKFICLLQVCAICLQYSHDDVIG